MDIKPIIARLVSSSSTRQKFLQSFPNLLSDYYLSSDGQILTGQEAKQLDALNGFLRNSGETCLVSRK